ncbi:MAG: hypothetical protein KJ601_05215 [Nanoarchaeota archaeon]|nr:hypothetical protein [Nanoarchaeota archaeon]MBU1704524.1 hypothetical protein [Nanoarchaeota archaeon]
MKFRSKLSVYDDPATLHNVFSPEIEERARSQVSLKKAKGHVEFDIKADDAVAFRATVNSLMKLLLVFEKMKVLADGK